MDSILRSGSIARLRKATTLASTFLFAIATLFTAATAVTLLAPTSAVAQSGYAAQLSGVVSDSSGGVIPGAKK